MSTEDVHVNTYKVDGETYDDVLEKLFGAYQDGWITIGPNQKKPILLKDKDKKNSGNLKLGYEEAIIQDQ